MKKYLLLFVTLVLSGMLTSPAFAARYALLVGCNNGGTSVEPLHWAEEDAGRFAGILEQFGGFDRSATVTLLHPDPGALETALQGFRRTLRISKSPDADLFLFYFSGHADGRDLLLGGRGYPLEKIQKYLDSLPSAIRIGIFDACQSGTVAEYKGGRRAEPFYLTGRQKVKGEVIIASASASERAQEAESLRGSIFSFYWQSGLRGSADFSGDRRVTLDEAYRYAYRKTVETSTMTGGEAQHPMYRFNIRGEGDIVLTDLSTATGGILFDKSCEGKFLVLSDSYTDIFADFFKKKNTECFISLNPGNYTAINANSGEVGMYSFMIGQNNSTVQLAQSMLEPNALTESRIKGANAVAMAKIETPATEPLSSFSWGMGIGAHSLFSGNNDKGQSVSLSLTNRFRINDRVNLFLDASYRTRGLNLGADIGFDYLWNSGSSGFSVGLGGGIFYYKDNGPSFDKALTPEAVAHIGFTTDIGRQTQVSAQVPYVVSFGPATMQSVGLEVRLIFCGPYRDIKVLKY